MPTPTPLSPRRRDSVLGEPRPCRAKIRPIYPARFSLTQSALDNAKASGQAPLPAVGLTDTNYELRRLRQGYFYIYSQLHIGKTTDIKGKWLIFKYTVSRDDSNGPELSQDERNLAYCFTQYEWTEGDPRKGWKEAEGLKRYPYAFVNAQTAVIEFAYSEYRWPAELFEKLEADAVVRSKLMQKLALKSLETNFSFVLTEESLAAGVADFNPDRQQTDLAQNQTCRATVVGYNPQHQLVIPEACENGEPIVVAVFDPIGDINDVAMYNLTMTVNDANERAKELYPIATAKAVKSLERFLRVNSYSGFPVGDANKQDGLFSGIGRAIFRNASEEKGGGKGNNAMWQQMEQYLPYRATKYEQAMINLTRVHCRLLMQRDNYSVFTQMSVVNRLMTDYADQPNKRHAVANYLMDLFASSQAGLSSRAKGIDAQAQLLKLAAVKLTEGKSLAQTPEKAPQSYGDYLANILNVADKSNGLVQAGTELVEFSRQKFNLLIGEIAAGQLYLWQRTATNSLMFDSYLRVFGMRLKQMPPLGMREATEVIREQMHALVQGRISHLEGTSAVLQSRENILAGWTQIEVSEQSKASRLINEKTRHVGVFLASVSLLSNLTKWVEAQEGEVSYEYAIAQSVADFSGLIAALERKGENIAREGAKRLFQRMERMAGEYGLPFAHVSEAGKGIAGKILSFETAGRLAGIAAIMIAYNDYRQGSGSGDKAKRDAALVLAVGEVSAILSSFKFVSGLQRGLGVFGFALGLVSVMISLFGDNPYEAWVRTGFWGNSENYWDKKKRQELSDRISIVEALGDESNNGFKRVKNLFDQEMQAYYNLVWGLTVLPKGNQWQYLEVHCPAFKDEQNIAQKLRVSVQIEEFHGEVQAAESALCPSVSQVGNRIFIDLSAEKLFKAYRSIKIAQNGGIAKPRVDILTVKVKYPKLGEQTDNFWQQYNAAYFEGEIVLEGAY
ncbi:toxin VasX [Aggregatibacter actinomycetemcomitans]|uniref:toxin VasX n=1 Tax=Aggregatibacter actinomycetemcomitans TaxID=714 RepID=UPI001F4334DD|nr:toxin VasX [Aggregatibacter actinomycetemcomitans]